MQLLRSFAAAVRLQHTAAAATSLQHPFSMHNRCVVKKLLAAGPAAVGESVVIGGWVRAGRTAEAGAVAFLDVSDGSSLRPVQCVVDKMVHAAKALTGTGTAVMLRGVVRAHPARAGEIEVHATEILSVGDCPNDYPLRKGKAALSLEFLRSNMHLRVRTNTFAAVARVRNALAAATHRFFQEQGFLYVHTPIVTASDCEGAGEMFQLTTLLAKAEKDNMVPGPTSEEVTQATALVSRLLAPPLSKTTTAELVAARAALAALQDKQASAGGLARRGHDQKIDYGKDFFGRPAHLTVSGQLEAEAYACALSSVYTFGPTFRAENSNTTRHLAEFWMVEPEIAFCNLAGVMDCAEAYVQYCLKAALAECRDDLLFLQARDVASSSSSSLVMRLEAVARTPFVRMTYTAGIEALQQAVAAGVSFENPQIRWGMDLGAEHEHYLAEAVVKGPVMLHDYPVGIKSFYMRVNDDNRTVAAMDVLVPQIGELVGGSQREDRADVLESRLAQAGLDADAYRWYVDLRRFGSVPHAGFGLGFERLVQFVTGMENIRDVIPFPRWAKHIS